MGIKNYLVPNHFIFTSRFSLSFRVAPSWKVNINKKSNLFKDIRKNTISQLFSLIVYVLIYSEVASLKNF